MSEEKIKEEILKDARVKVEKILARARTAEETVLAGAKQEAEDYYSSAMADAKSRAEQEKKRIFGNIPLEEQRIIRRSQEQVIEKAVRSALNIMSPGDQFDYPSSLRFLIMEAALALDEDLILCRIRNEDQPIFSEVFVKSLEQEIRTGCGKEVKIGITADPGQRKPGVVCETRDGRKLFDNTYDARLKRFKEEIRLKAAEILKLL